MIENIIESNVIYEKEDLKTIEGYDEFKAGTISFLKKIEIYLLDIKPGESFLDIGCGRGEVAQYIFNMTKNVFAIDISQAAVDSARSLCGNNAIIIKSCVTKIPFPDESMDKILCGDVIEHLTINDSDKMLKECKRLLRKGGKLLIHTAPNKSFMKYVFPLFYWLLYLIKSSKIEQLNKKLDDERKYHINVYTPRRLFKQCAEAGFNCQFKWKVGLLREGRHLLTGSSFLKVSAKIIDPISKLPLIRNIMVNDLYLIVSKID